ncbi:MAG: SRPBCC family protein [Rhizomicrobium sp.]|jgi:uncharacterized membrane protein YhaH (DUF805 family)
MFDILLFSGRIRRAHYLAASLPLFFLPHSFVAAILFRRGQTNNVDPMFWLEPVRALLWVQPLSLAEISACFFVTLLATWLLTALSFCRARDAGLGGWNAAPVLVPVLQIPVILVLGIARSRHSGTTASKTESGSLDWQSALRGIVAGMALTVFAVAVGTLLFGTYGYGLFFVSPFLIGAITAYLANRNGDIGFRRTTSVVAAAAFLGALSLLGVALEGLICIIVAAPLAVLAALLGSVFGRAAALHTRRSATQPLMSVALLPLVFISERLLPPSIRFDTQESIDISAPRPKVWDAIVHMAPLTEEPALPFRFGVAYPVAARMTGQGVGAMRVGVFSTGIAVERVTEWRPNKLFAFAVLSNPPAMHELSPYRTVNAPHLRGYFTTSFTSFELIPLGGGRTRIVERTQHELKLDPVFYWLPMARFIIHENNMRVLAHIRAQAMIVTD